MGPAHQQRVHVQLLALVVCAAALQAEIKLSIATQPTNSFDPRTAIGAGIDGHEEGEIAAHLTPAAVRQMRETGLKSLTYRLRTELAGEAWHWTGHGVWSDPAYSQGYWTGNPKPNDTPDPVTYGYRLPRRGNTTDQANNDGYSRIDDDDPTSFWKSNPYLGDRPQWVIADLGRKQRIDTVRIDWGEPRASRFHLQYSSANYIDLTADRDWQPFEQRRPRDVRWLRIALDESAGGTAQDWRDRTGFAIRELSAGSTDRAGKFTDVIRHAPFHSRQTEIYVSSTDPWHRAQDRDPKIEQPGFGLAFQSGLSNGLPVLMPVPVLYDIPENAAALMAYLDAEGFPIIDVELGEEPEEQFVSPEDYGELSRKTIAAIRAQNLNYRFGGPSLILLAPHLETDADWMARLYRYYRSTASLDALGFFSFEWYPFDNVCGDVSKQLAQSGNLLQGALDKIAKAGIPRAISWFMTEYGYSAYGAQAEIDLPGAIFNAESVALFLTSGGARAYLYGYEPGELLHDRPCTWGNNMILYNGKPTASYWAARLLTQAWADPNGGTHSAFPVVTGAPLVSAYAVRRPNGSLSILILNKSPTVSETVGSPFQEPVTVTQFSAAQYQWQAAGENGRILRSDMPAVMRQTTGSVVLPPYSLTVLASPPGNPENIPAPDSLLQHGRTRTPQSH